MVLLTPNSSNTNNVYNANSNNRNVNNNNANNTTNGARPATFLETKNIYTIVKYEKPKKISNYPQV